MFRATGGEYLYVEAPVIAAGATDTLLVGRQGFATRPGPIVELIGGLRLAAGGAVSALPLLPSPGAVASEPRAVVTDDGVTHVVWGTRQPNAMVISPADALWHTTWTGGGWAAPTRVADGAGLHWALGTPSALLVHDGALHVAVPCRTPTVCGSVAVLSRPIAELGRPGGDWARRLVPGTRRAYAAQLAAAHGQLVVAHVADADEAERSGGQDVRVTRMASNGDTAGRIAPGPSLHRGFQGRVLRDLALVGDGAGTLHVAWAVTQFASAGVDSVYASVSHDAGARWLALPAAAAPPGTDVVRVGVADGVLRVVTRAGSVDDALVAHCVLPGGWTSAPIVGERGGSTPIVWARPTRAEVVWGSEIGSPTGAPVLRRRALPACRAR